MISAEIPVLQNESRPVLGDVAAIKPDTSYGENDNLGALPFLSVTANINNKDLGTATKDVKAAILSLGELPRGLTVETKGLSEVLTDTLSSLQVGLITAIAVIFLMLAANFQSFKVSLVVLSTVPAVLLGSLVMLLLTGSTLNLQSYMGIIMSVGVSIANSVLLITNAEHLRNHTGNAMLSAKESAALRIRPILMTSLAMVVGHAADGIRHRRRGRSGRAAGSRCGRWIDRFHFCRTVYITPGIYLGAGQSINCICIP